MCIWTQEYGLTARNGRQRDENHGWKRGGMVTFLTVLGGLGKRQADGAFAASFYSFARLR